MSRRIDLVSDIESAVEGEVQAAENMAGGLYERIIRKAFYETIYEPTFRAALADALHANHLICEACYAWEHDNHLPNPSVAGTCRCPTLEQLDWLLKQAAA